MNDRIDELIEQASVRGQVYLPGDDGHPSPTFYFDKRKFAELIVRECAKFIDENSGADQCNNVWCPAPEELLQHFGVKNAILS